MFAFANVIYKDSLGRIVVDGRHPLLVKRHPSCRVVPQTCSKRSAQRLFVVTTMPVNCNIGWLYVVMM